MGEQETAPAEGCFSLGVYPDIPEEFRPRMGVISYPPYAPKPVAGVSAQGQLLHLFQPGLPWPEKHKSHEEDPLRFPVFSPTGPGLDHLMLP
jgi:hypothetical protein